MAWIVANIHRIMIVSGVMTLTMISVDGVSTKGATVTNRSATLETLATEASIGTRAPWDKDSIFSVRSRA
jgi:hypothetical protein